MKRAAVYNVVFRSLVWEYGGLLSMTLAVAHQPRGCGLKGVSIELLRVLGRSWDPQWGRVPFSFGSPSNKDHRLLGV